MLNFFLEYWVKPGDDDPYRLQFGGSKDTVAAMLKSVGSSSANFHFPLGSEKNCEQLRGRTRTQVRRRQGDSFMPGLRWSSRVEKAGRAVVRRGR